MTNKITSEEAYESLRSVDAGVLSFAQFDRQTLQNALDIRANLSDQEFPSAKSFLDWARREGLVETVSRGHYRWAVVTEQEAAEVGRQIAAESEQVLVPDTDPEHPMTLTDADAVLDDFADLINHLAQAFEEMSDDVQRTADAIQAHAQAYPEDLHLVIDDVPRLPRKLKKRMKRDLINHTAAQKVTFSFEPVPS